jgi:hypothetical protein
VQPGERPDLRLRSILLAAAFAGACVSGCGADPVRLHAYPQKSAAFYQANDAAVPETLQRAPSPPPSGDANCAATAADGAVWLGTRAGLIRIDYAADPLDRKQYFAGRRYLPDDDVLNLVPDSSTGVWARTSTGVSHIELRPMTLEQKAGYFERRVHARHDRYGLVASSILRVRGDLTTNQLDPSDNDGLWTAIYAAAECFRYAATRSSEALAHARKSIDAVLFLERITGRSGFPARSYIRAGDFREPDGVWHWTRDHKYEWKADTSSDEIVGHFFLFSVAWDLLPDPDLQQRIRETAARIADHILEHGYTLTDVTGKPTTWGRWSREYFESENGKPDSPLNALELLSILKTAAHVTGDAKYEFAYRKAALDLKYLDQAARLAELTHEINYSDEELAMLSFYPIFRYEQDPRLLKLYRSAADQWWRNIQREWNPLWTLIYLQSRPTKPVDLAGAAWTLYRIPMDTIEWTVRNSSRRDVTVDAAHDRFGQRQSTTLLPPDERPVMKWNSNPFQLDGGNGGRTEDDGAFFLLPYWMGRYLGSLLE